MRRSKRLNLYFFVIGFCSCLILIALVRFCGSLDWDRSEPAREVTFHQLGHCPDCKVISSKHWKIGKLKDKNDLHLESARRLGIQPFETDAAMEAGVPALLRRGKLVELKEDARYYRLKPLTHSKPYLVPEALDLLEEIGERFQKKLGTAGLPTYYVMVSSVLRTVESQQGLGRRNVNATKNESSHIYGTSFDITYKEFLPAHGQPAPEGYCRHDLLRHPLAEVLTELSNEGKCRVVQEIKQACFHITVNK